MGAKTQMTDDSFQRFRCWRTAEVQQTIFGDIGSLREQDDAVFLAAHASVPVHRRKGPAAEDRGEAEILSALRDEIGIPGRNTLIAITGDVGTGKSHAVRWVNAHLTNDPVRYRTIYIPRDLSTLRGLLGRILAGLPGAKARQAEHHLEDAIGRKSDSQLRDELIDNLRQVLAHELSDQGLKDQDADDREDRSFLLGTRKDRESRRRGGLADILLNLRVIEHLSRDGGTVAAVIHSLQTKRGGRDEEYPHFTMDDIPTRTTGITNRLDPGARSVWESVRTDPGPAVALLNEALQRGVRMTLGFGTGLTLNEVFLETRELLRRKGTELVLLFEDLALFGLIDDDLYDQFSQQPTDKYCPLRVIFAITTARYLEMPDTVRDRITHHYEIQNLEGGEDGGVDPAMVKFVARYLNNARVGRAALIAARSGADDRAREEGAWIPNACEILDNGEACPHREECFGAFGSVNTGPNGQVGLYPHNLISLRRAFRHLRDENRLSPRSLVNDVVQSFLTTADPEISAGIFPTEEIRGWFYLGVGRAREAIVREDELSSPEQRERLRRARIVWADGAPEPPGIHVAFDLPGNVMPRLDPEPRQLPIHVPDPDPPPGQKPDRAQSLYDWESTIATLPDQERDEFRRVFHRWTGARLDLGRHLMNTNGAKVQVVLNRIFPEASFFIHGASEMHAGGGRLRFDVPRSSVGLRLLLAARWFEDHGHWDAADLDREWDFPANFQPADLQVELENFVSTCASVVEERFLEVISTTRGVRPAAAVVTLRVAALRVLGQLGREDRTRIIAAIAQNRDEATDSWSPPWKELARPALQTIRSIEAGLIAEFAAARQDTGSPIVIDAADLEPVGWAAIDDPATALARLGSFHDLFSEFEQARGALTANWAAAVAGERKGLVACLQFLRATADSAERDIGTWAEELGTRANDDRVFRPIGTYLRFRQETATLRSHSQDSVNEWINYEATIGDPGSPTAVLDAQSWATQARSYVDALQFVLTAMKATAELLEERTARSVGANPDVLAERVAGRLDDAAGLLERLEQGDPE